MERKRSSMKSLNKVTSVHTDRSRHEGGAPTHLIYYNHHRNVASKERGQMLIFRLISECGGAGFLQTELVQYSRGQRSAVRARFNLHVILIAPTDVSIS